MPRDGAIIFGDLIGIPRCAACRVRHMIGPKMINQ
jgi:hypothetical protein